MLPRARVRTAFALLCGLVNFGAIAALHHNPGSAAPPSLTSWAADLTDTSSPTVVNTHAPVLRWPSIVSPGSLGFRETAVLSLTVEIPKLCLRTAGQKRPDPSEWGLNERGDAPACTQAWTSGEMRMAVLDTWMGLYVVDGHNGLTPDTLYSWTVTERVVVFSNGTAAPPSASATHHGQFRTAPSLVSPAAEAASAMAGANFTKLWNGSVTSVAGRIQPSGFLPTSVSGGYGGITMEYPRDASGQIIGLMYQGPEFHPLAKSALQFMLQQLKEAYKPGASFNSYAPHVMTANKELTKIVGFDTRDQTDDTFYLIAAWGAYSNLTGDTSLERPFYDLLAGYADHYLAAGAKSLGFGGTPQAPSLGGGVPYWNESLSLLWNPNLEHSRLGSFWSAYDQVANSMAVEGLRALEAAATRLGIRDDAARWATHRAAILHGIDTSLTYTFEDGAAMYAELRGHENAFSEDKGSVGFSPLLPGASFVSVIPLVMGLTVMGSASPDVEAHAEALGLDIAKMDTTWNLIRRQASFQWVNQDPTLSAFVPTTHVNTSGLTNPPVRTTPLPSNVTMGCNRSARLVGAAALTLASGADMCDPSTSSEICGNVTTADYCCALAQTYPSRSSPAVGAWFFNGATTACSGHGCCYLKKVGSPDTFTKPDPNFSAGYGPAAFDDWCAYSGKFNTADACPAPGGTSCSCGSYAVIGKTVGWELGWAAFRHDFVRLTVLHRWLGQAAHVEQTTLFGESYEYSCIKEGEAEGFAPAVGPKTPRGAGCWGDPGNGVQIGWFLWGEALAKAAVARAQPN